MRSWGEKEGAWREAVDGFLVPVSKAGITQNLASPSLYSPSLSLSFRLLPLPLPLHSLTLPVLLSCHIHVYIIRPSVLRSPLIQPLQPVVSRTETIQPGHNVYA